MSYSNDLWESYDIIKKHFLSHCNTIKSLLYFITEHKNLEYEYAEGLSNLISSSSKISSLSSSSFSFDKAIYSYYTAIQSENKSRLNLLKSIESNLLNPFRNFFLEQLSTYNTLLSSISKSTKDFEQVLTNLSSIQNDFYSSINITEATLTKLTKAKNNPLYSQTPEKINQWNLMNEKKIKLALEYQRKYKEYVIEANIAREMYIKTNKEILYNFEAMEHKCINATKDYLLMLCNDYEELEYKDIMKSKEIQRAIYNKISAEEDINDFVKKNKSCYSPPIEFTFVPYDVNNQFISNTNSNSDNTINSNNHYNKSNSNFKEIYENEISKQVLKTLKSIFQYQTPEEKHDKLFSYNTEEIEKITFASWEGKSIPPESLQEITSLFTSKIYRRYFLNIMDRYRIKGLFELNENCYNFLKTILHSIMLNCFKDKDYTNLKLCIILSQTFNYKSQLLQGALESDEGIRNKEIWIGLIDTSIETELNSISEYKKLLTVKEADRERNLASLVFGILVTFKYNMGLFSISKKLIDEIMKEYATKYKVDIEMLYELNCNDGNDDGNIIRDAIQNNNEESVIS